MVVLEVYCTCGSGMEGSLDPRGVDAYRGAWLSVHSGDGHAPCTREQAVAEHVRRDGCEPSKRHEAGDIEESL